MAQRQKAACPLRSTAQDGHRERSWPTYRKKSVQDLLGGGVRRWTGLAAHAVQVPWKHGKMNELPRNARVSPVAASFEVVSLHSCCMVQRWVHEQCLAVWRQQLRVRSRSREAGESCDLCQARFMIDPPARLQTGFRGWLRAELWRAFGWVELAIEAASPALRVLRLMIEAMQITATVSGALFGIIGALLGGWSGWKVSQP